MFEAIAVIFDLILALVDFLGICLKFLLQRLGLAESKAEDISNRIGCSIVGVFVAVLVFLAVIIKR